MLTESPNQRFVAYYRVSTARQGQSGLGLEAQQASVAQFINQRDGSLIEEFTEVETGKGKNALSKRPQLAAALASCKRSRAQLVIAKLDRLARNVYFVSGLMEAGVDFVAVDCPTKDKFRLHLEAVFAEEEARRISIRTKQALARLGVLSWERMERYWRGRTVRRPLPLQNHWPMWWPTSGRLATQRSGRLLPS